MLKIIKEHEDVFRLSRINDDKLGEISGRALHEHAVVGTVYAAERGVNDKTDKFREAYLTKPFSEFTSDENIKKFAKTLAKELAKEGILVKEKEIEEAFKRAKPVAESLAKNAYNNPSPSKVIEGLDTQPYIIELIKLNRELRQFLAEISGKKIDPAKPKYPTTKKEVGEELRKAGVPEERVKVVAPRLATAMWLDKWFENAAKSYTYKKLGGVPLDELKNLRNMILAKKHVAEAAAKVMEEHWTKNNHVKIGEGHVDKKMLPLVREHASGMFEDLEKVREMVRKGKMSVEEAILRLHAELFVLYTALEFAGELVGTPDYLVTNPRPLGAEDAYVVTLEAIKKIHERLKGTLGIYFR